MNLLRFSVGMGLSLLALTSVAAATPLLSLSDAQRIAQSDAPPLEAQAAALRAAQHARLSAGERSDPKLILAVDNIPIDGADQYNLTRDFMTMRKIGFMQDFVREEKLSLRGDRAAAEVQKEAAILMFTRSNLRRDVALAWIERYFAERQMALLKEMARETELQISLAVAVLAGGKGQATEPLTARLALAQLTDRSIDAERNVARAQALLTRWIGAAAKQPLDLAPSFDQLAHHQQDLTGNLETHPNLAMYAPMTAMAAIELKLADAAKRPDWSLEVAYAQRGPSFSNMLSIGVRIDLPIFQSRRQDPAMAAKVAQLDQVRAQAEDARRMHVAEVDILLADWNAASARLARYQSELLPLAAERTAVMLAGYRGGKGELAPLLDARKGEIDARINHLQIQSEQARAWAHLNFILPTTKESP